MAPRAGSRDDGTDEWQPNAAKAGPSFSDQPCQAVPQSPFRGVTFDKTEKTWRARIYNSGKQLHVGRYSTELEAAQAYDAAASMLGETLERRYNFGSAVAAELLPKFAARPFFVRLAQRGVPPRPPPPARAARAGGSPKPRPPRARWPRPAAAAPADSAMSDPSGAPSARGDGDGASACGSPVDSRPPAAAPLPLAQMALTACTSLAGEASWPAPAGAAAPQPCGPAAAGCSSSASDDTALADAAPPALAAVALRVPLAGPDGCRAQSAPPGFWLDDISPAASVAAAAAAATASLGAEPLGDMPVLAAAAIAAAPPRCPPPMPGGAAAAPFPRCASVPQLWGLQGAALPGPQAPRAKAASAFADPSVADLLAPLLLSAGPAPPLLAPPSPLRGAAAGGGARGCSFDELCTDMVELSALYLTWSSG